MKPFHESYKQFKENFFWVSEGEARPSVLFDVSDNSFFPLYWSDRLTILIMVGRDDLEDWVYDFVEELIEMAPLSCSKLITDKGYTNKDIVRIRVEEQASLSTILVAKVVPVSVVQPANEVVQGPVVRSLDPAI
ncbi:hypothetical protein CR513_32722, partial [Mucuna pruriens]